jgi:hypothetical protein
LLDKTKGAKKLKKTAWHLLSSHVGVFRVNLDLNSDSSSPETVPDITYYFNPVLLS